MGEMGIMMYPNAASGWNLSGSQVFIKKTTSTWFPLESTILVAIQPGKKKSLQVKKKSCTLGFCFEIPLRLNWNIFLKTRILRALCGEEAALKTQTEIQLKMELDRKSGFPRYYFLWDFWVGNKLKLLQPKIIKVLNDHQVKNMNAHVYT